MIFKNRFKKESDKLQAFSLQLPPPLFQKSFYPRLQYPVLCPFPNIRAVQEGNCYQQPDR